MRDSIVEAIARGYHRPMKTTFRFLIVLAALALGCRTTDTPAAANAEPEPVAEPAAPETPPEPPSVAETDAAPSEPKFDGMKYNHTQIAHPLKRRSPALLKAVVQALGAKNVPGHDTEGIYYSEPEPGTVILNLMFPEGFVHPVHGPQARVRTMTCIEAGESWTCDI